MMNILYLVSEGVKWNQRTVVPMYQTSTGDWLKRREECLPLRSGSHNVTELTNVNERTNAADSGGKRAFFPAWRLPLAVENCLASAILDSGHH
jgi:hypothetical protein